MINWRDSSLVIARFFPQGSIISGAASLGNLIAGCYVGTDASCSWQWQVAFPELNRPERPHGNTIGGVTGADRKRQLWQLRSAAS